MSPHLPAEIAFEAVADEVFSSYRRHWKPRTLAVNVNYYENHILPWFKGRQIAGITRREVLEWFESLHAKPDVGEPISCRCYRSSCGKPRCTDTGQRTAILAKISSATAAARGNAFCHRTRSAVSSRF